MTRKVELPPKSATRPVNNDPLENDESKKFGSTIAGTEPGEYGVKFKDNYGTYKPPEGFTIESVGKRVTYTIIWVVRED